MKIRELIYTSAPRGLKPGTSGFCTVMMTRGIPSPTLELLERVSNNYNVLYLPYDDRARDNPVGVSLLKARFGNQNLTVLSRTCAAGADHTGRSNILSHHLLISDLNPGFGPVDAAVDPETFITGWTGEPELRESRDIDGFRDNVSVCTLWRQTTGSERWAGRLAQSWMGEAPAPLYVVFPAGVNMLGLIKEAIGILPAERQWSATFSTYFCGLPSEMNCQVRCVLKGTPHEAEARRSEHIDLLNLHASLPSGRWADRAAGTINRPKDKTDESENSDSSPSQTPETLKFNRAADNPQSFTAEDSPPPVYAAPQRSLHLSQKNDRFTPAVIARTPLSYVLSPPGWLFWLTVILMAVCLTMVALSKSIKTLINDVEDTRNSIHTPQKTPANYIKDPVSVIDTEIKIPKSSIGIEEEVNAMELESRKLEIENISNNYTGLLKNIEKIQNENNNLTVQIIQFKKANLLQEKKIKELESDSKIDSVTKNALREQQDLEIKQQSGEYYLPQNIKGIKIGSLRVSRYLNEKNDTWSIYDDLMIFEIGSESQQWKIRPHKKTIKNPKFKPDQKTNEPEYIDIITDFSKYISDLKDKQPDNQKLFLVLDIKGKDEINTSQIYLRINIPAAKKK